MSDSHGFKVVMQEFGFFISVAMGNKDKHSEFVEGSYFRLLFRLWKQNILLFFRQDHHVV